ncbi:hypothetical protein B0H13DRAFT_2356412 [Mycena leptocephala]|nr:hypothetical protein B0H13DRAFT_2356412 [Mycena leptocephala]
MVTSVGLLLFLAFTFVFCNGPSYHVQARLVSRPKRSANVQRDALSDSGLRSASWIWASNSDGSASTSAGNVAFFKNITTPSKSASSAVISITGVDNFTLFVNGQPIGASNDTQDGWKSALVLRAALNATGNIFSVLVANGGKSTVPPPGFLAAIRVSYTDSPNSDTFVSDSSWLATRDIPPDFPNPSNLSHFASAAVAAPNGSGPWGQSVFLPLPDPSPLTLNESSWIWSTPNANVSTDVGTVGFRKNFSTPSGKSAQSATILLTVDNSFALYLNGEYLGSPPQSSAGFWQYAQQFTVGLKNATSNVFTVIAQNFPLDGTPHSSGNSAGFIAAIKVVYEDGTSDIIRTDSSWLNSNLISLPVFLASDDELLSLSFVLGPLGMPPWNQLSGISDVLSAASVLAVSVSSSTSAPSSPAPSSPASSPGPGPSSASHSALVGTIVATIVGTIVLVVLLIAVIIWQRRRRNPKSADTEATANLVVPFSEYSAVAPSAARTDASNFRPGLPPAPLRNKFGAAAVMQRNVDVRSVEDAELAPPSYAFVESAGPSTVNGDSVMRRNVKVR